GVAFKVHARGRTVGQVLGVAGHRGLELGADGILVEVEVHDAGAQAAVGVQVLGGVHAGDRRGLGGRGRGRLDRRRGGLLDLLGAGDRRRAQQRGQQDAGGGVHGDSSSVGTVGMTTTTVNRLLDGRIQRRVRYGPHAGSRTSPSASTRRWRTRASAETAYSTPRPPSLAAYSNIPAFGAKLGDSSSEPGDSMLQRGVPRLRSSKAMR